MTEQKKQANQAKPSPKNLAEATYPAGMEKERKLPESGDDKPGPRNPTPLEE